MYRLVMQLAMEKFMSHAKTNTTLPREDENLSHKAKSRDLVRLVSLTIGDQEVMVRFSSAVFSF